MAVANVTFGATLNVGESYNDNIFFDDNNKVDDFATLISPGIGLRYDSKDVILGAIYQPTAQIFAKETGQNRFIQNLNLLVDFPGLSQQFAGVTIQFIESLNFTPSLPGFDFGDPTVGTEQRLGQLQTQQIVSGGSQLTPDQLTQNLVQQGTGGAIGARNLGAQTRRTNTFRNTAGFRATFAVSPRNVPFFGYTNTIVEFTDSQFQDSITNNFTLGNRYLWSPTTSIIFNYGLGILTFRGGQQQQNQDTRFVHRATLGTVQLFTPTLSGRVNLGANFTQKTSTQPERVTFNFNAGLSKIFSVARLALNANQGVGTGGGLFDVPTLNQSVTGSANFPIYRNLSGFVQLGFARNSTLTGEGFEVLSYQANTGVQFAILRWLSGSFRYAWTQQDAKTTITTDNVANISNANRNFFFFGFTVIPQPWSLVE